MPYEFYAQIAKPAKAIYYQCNTDSKLLDYYYLKFINVWKIGDSSEVKQDFVSWVQKYFK